MPNQTLQHRTDCKLIQELLSHYKNGTLNLEPGFQRQSVWKESDRAKLIDSIVKNYPLPAIFLYKRHENGQLIYDVIDGKQRLESIFMFMGEMNGRFKAKVQMPGSQEPEWIDWKKKSNYGIHQIVNGYLIPTIEVDGEFTDIVDVFVRINSTGKALTSQEKRHARYYSSPFLKEASKLARRYENKLYNMNVFSNNDLNRMKHVEFVSEIMLSLHQGDVLNKKTALDKIMKANALNGRDIHKASHKTVTAINRVFAMFPKLKTTRFVKQTDFYSLVVLIGKFESERLILTDRKRNNLAWDLLSAFGIKVDEIRDKQRRIQGIKQDEELYRSYLMTVSQMTDDISQRQKREEILRGIIASLFARKDNQRGFTAEQRRIMWNKTAVNRCSGTTCKHAILTWDDFTIDHINPYSKGGRSSLKNAAVLCRKCNSSKSNRK